MDGICSVAKYSRMLLPQIIYNQIVSYIERFWQASFLKFKVVHIHYAPQLTAAVHTQVHYVQQVSTRSY